MIFVVVFVVFVGCGDGDVVEAVELLVAGAEFCPLTNINQ
jgi:hypothetical protein